MAAHRVAELPQEQRAALCGAVQRRCGQRIPPRSAQGAGSGGNHGAGRGGSTEPPPFGSQCRDPALSDPLVCLRARDGRAAAGERGAGSTVRSGPEKRAAPPKASPAPGARSAGSAGDRLSRSGKAGGRSSCPGRNQTGAARRTAGGRAAIPL